MTNIRKAVAAALALCLIAPLAACEGQVPAVSSPTAATSAAPDLTQAQEKKIRLRILDGLSQATEAKSAKGLDQYATGPFLDIRTSELAVLSKTGKMRAEATIPDGISQTVIPTDSGWPRSVYTITTTTEDQQPKRLLVLTQDSARANYKLWGVARLFPGAKLPSFAIPTIGTPMGAPSDTGLVLTPQQAVTQYADVLTHGTDSQYAKNFADDHLRQLISELATKVQQGVERNKGSQEQTFTADTSSIQVMRSTDGGDLVVARITSQWTRKAGEGRESLPANDEETVLFANGKATSTMRVSYVNVIALYVPSKDSKQPVTAVGADRYPIKVEAL